MTRVPHGNRAEAERVEVALDVPRFVYYLTEQPPQIAIRATAPMDSPSWVPRRWPPVGLMQALCATPGIVERGIGGEQHIPLRDIPRETDPTAEVDQLFIILKRFDRLPIVVLTRPDRRRRGAPPPTYVLDGSDLAKKLCGQAHVVQMPPDACRRWTDLVGREMTAFWGAVAIYQPVLAMLQDEDPARHERWLAEQILSFSYGSDEGTEAFGNFLLDKLARTAARRRVEGHPLFFYDYVASCRVGNAIHETRESQRAESVEALQEQVSTMSDRVVAAEASARDWEQIANDCDIEAQQARREFLVVADQLALGERRTQDRSGRPVSAESQIPSSLKEGRGDMWQHAGCPTSLLSTLASDKGSRGLRL